MLTLNFFITVVLHSLSTGQKAYRNEWGRYARGCNLIAFVVDTQAPQLLAVAKQELHQLLEDPDLAVRRV